MANTYLTTLVEVTTTGSNVVVFNASSKCIVRDVMIYAKGTTPTVSVLFNDRTSTLVVAKESMATDATFRPFATPLAMPSSSEIIVNTSADLHVLITYVQFT